MGVKNGRGEERGLIGSRKGIIVQVFGRIPSLFIYFFFLLNLFIFGCAGSSLLPSGFLQLQRAGGFSVGGAWAFHCCGFSGWALGTDFSSCGARA